MAGLERPGENERPAFLIAVFPLFSRLGGYSPHPPAQFTDCRDQVIQRGIVLPLSTPRLH